MPSLAEDVRGKSDAGHIKELLTSDSANWKSLYLQSIERAYSPDPYPIGAFTNPSIILIHERHFRVSHFSEGRWRKIDYSRGTGILTPAGLPRLVRHDSVGKVLNCSLLVLPQETLDFVAREVQKPSTISDRPFFDDPVISDLAFSAMSALRGGAPDFYAQTAAQWISAHLLLGATKGDEWRQSLAKERISDYRLVRVLEYIEAHFAERLDLGVLSKVAAISPFHFATLFRRAVGTTPHRHVQHIRMEAAKAMLIDTDKAILEIGLTCGFGNASHFASAFRRQFSQSPLEYRSTHGQFKKRKRCPIE
ncbi:Transcriptional regulator, AraC family [Acidisarcina polymorpha]|uniref:Transcriptional regulator, AraC family n=1 Tax=Acidisarcina polymorpha TaxID=2211140 RepID=A0A2Z5FYP8_9BACT|nr:AraC family transcriptional regulator [Acidisarcina polymorpha]AXC11932.1 Transcriptional regulator, AraC family [Acidisarcina polymorpha]